MPKIFEYLGILIYFYSNEHEPIHVHALKEENESRAEFIITDGIITEIRIQQVKGVSQLSTNEMKIFKEFLDVFADRIVQKWIDYFFCTKK